MGSCSYCLPLFVQVPAKQQHKKQSQEQLASLVEQAKKKSEPKPDGAKPQTEETAKSQEDATGKEAGEGLEVEKDVGPEKQTESAGTGQSSVITPGMVSPLYRLVTPSIILGLGFFPGYILPCFESLKTVEFSWAYPGIPS